jgi:hypothetical protein
VRLFRDLVLPDKFVEFLTIPAYRILVSAGEVAEKPERAAVFA